MRVTSLDFSNASTSCPIGLQERVDSGIRIYICGIESSGARCICPSVMLSTGDDIDGNYVVESALHNYGDTPRNHIWTFVGGRLSDSRF